MRAACGLIVSDDLRTTKRAFSIQYHSQAETEITTQPGLHKNKAADSKKNGFKFQKEVVLIFTTSATSEKYSTNKEEECLIHEYAPYILILRIKPVS